MTMRRCWRRCSAVSSRCGSSPITSTTPILPAAPRIFAPASRPASASFAALRGRVSGLCQPTYVLDIPGGYGKVPIAPCAAGREAHPAGGSSRTGPGPARLSARSRRSGGLREPAVAEPGDPVMIVIGGGAIALSTAQELCALQGHRVVVLWRRDPDLARAVEGIGAVFITAPARIAARGSTAPGCATRSRSSRCRPTISSICTRHSWRATPIRGSASYCGSSTGPSPTRSSRTCRTARFCRSPGIRPRPMPRPRSTRPASAGCNSPSRTAR